MDKAFWASVIQTEFAVPDGHQAFEYAPELMAGLGSLDSEYRDELCLEVLCSWIYGGAFTPEELRAIKNQMLCNLQVGLGEGENDHVFLRTFSVLVLRWIIQRDIIAPYLKTDEVREIMDQGLTYYAAEKDWRGYVPEKGWAHAVAHGADLLFGLAQHPGLEAADLERLVEAASMKAFTVTRYALINKEGFRMARVVTAVLKRNVVPAEWFVTWLEGIAGTTPRSSEYERERDMARYHNTETFLAALSVLTTFLEIDQSTKEKIRPALHAALRSFLPWCV